MKDKKVWIRTILCLFPIVIGLILWNQFPSQMPVHWNAEGKVDGWSSKAFAVFFLPLFMTGMELLVSFVLKSDPKNHHQDKFIYQLGLWIIPVLSIVIMIITYLTALGTKVPINIILMGILGIFFILLGNQMPKTRQNYTIGIKIPWTLNSEQNWNLTHRMAGPLWVIGGFAMILSGFVSDNTIFILCLVIDIFVLTLVPIIYSYILYNKGI